MRILSRRAPRQADCRRLRPRCRLLRRRQFSPLCADHQLCAPSAGQCLARAPIRKPSRCWPKRNAAEFCTRTFSSRRMFIQARILSAGSKGPGRHLPGPAGARQAGRGSHHPQAASRRTIAVLGLSGRAVHRQTAPPPGQEAKLAGVQRAERVLACGWLNTRDRVRVAAERGNPLWIASTPGPGSRQRRRNDPAALSENLLRNCQAGCRKKCEQYNPVAWLQPVGQARISGNLAPESA